MNQKRELTDFHLPVSSFLFVVFAEWILRQVEGVVE